MTECAVVLALVQIGSWPKLDGDVVDQIPAFGGPPFDEVQVLGEEGDDPDHPKEIGAASELGLVHLNPSVTLAGDGDLDQPLSTFAGYTCPDHRLVLVVGDHCCIGC